MSVTLNENYLKKFINEDEIKNIWHSVLCANKVLNEKNGAGNDFLGWTTLPEDYDKDEFVRIKAAAEKIKADTDVFLVIGIGGSYLGARAAIEFVNSSLYNNKNKSTPDIYFIGNNISSDYLSNILEICKGKRVSINVISKSGTTTEPAIAFRLLREYMENEYGEAAAERIYITTDKARGKLKELSDKQGYETFVVPDDVGGRFSVLTAVGLLPIAVSGADIDELMRGAYDAMNEYSKDDCSNPVLRYAAVRNILYNKGYRIEMLVNYDPSLVMIAEWFKQLFGESEGKDNKGLFPASVTFSTDLHSMGQYIQDGLRILFETVLWVKNSKTEILIKRDEKDADGLNFLEGKSISYVNSKAFQGTTLAHCDGNVPNVVLEIEDFSEYELGNLFYFFERTCAVSGYMLGVNPFDQPGVEAYKKNMFALLGKPGYEKEKEMLEKRL